MAVTATRQVHALKSRHWAFRFAAISTGVRTAGVTVAAIRITANRIAGTGRYYGVGVRPRVDRRSARNRARRRTSLGFS